MAKLLSTATWPEIDKAYPEYPVEFVLTLTPVPASDAQPGQWIDCRIIIGLQPYQDDKKSPLIEGSSQMLARDLERLIDDIKTFIQDQQGGNMTFVPITPGLEIWIQHLSDEQYRVIVWQDLSSRFNGISDVLHQGARFTTNRARLMGFVRGLETELRI